MPHTTRLCDVFFLFFSAVAASVVAASKFASYIVGMGGSGGILLEFTTRTTLLHVVASFVTAVDPEKLGVYCSKCCPSLVVTVCHCQAHVACLVWCGVLDWTGLGWAGLGQFHRQLRNASQPGMACRPILWPFGRSLPTTFAYHNKLYRHNLLACVCARARVYVRVCVCACMCIGIWAYSIYAEATWSAPKAHSAHAKPFY